MFNGFAESAVSGGTLGGFLLLAFALLIGHALADYPLQGAFLATGKNRNGDPSDFFGGTSVPKRLWLHALTAHSLIHAGFVWVITGSAALALAEFILHWIIDLIRCDERISYNIDQLFHCLCKLAYAALLASGMRMPF
ncbi:DUF3307 domain-containing protein [Akkermansiaceae bacterium]|nr:DUF3307 domain-containing protein [Akkermansiaceae bacterium]